MNILYLKMSKVPPEYSLKLCGQPKILQNLFNGLHAKTADSPTPTFNVLFWEVWERCICIFQSFDWKFVLFLTNSQDIPISFYSPQRIEYLKRGDGKHVPLPPLPLPLPPFTSPPSPSPHFSLPNSRNKWLLFPFIERGKETGGLKCFFSYHIGGVCWGGGGFVLGARREGLGFKY